MCDSKEYSVDDIKTLGLKLENGTLSDEECDNLGCALKRIYHELESNNHPVDSDRYTLLVIFHLYLIRKLGILHTAFLPFFNSDLRKVAQQYDEAKKYIEKVYKTIPKPDDLSFTNLMEKDDDADDALFIGEIKNFIIAIRNLITSLKGDECKTLSRKILRTIGNTNEKKKKMAYQWFYIFNLIHGIKMIDSRGPYARCSYDCEQMQTIPSELEAFLLKTGGTVKGAARMTRRMRQKHHIRRRNRRRTRRSK